MKIFGEIWKNMEINIKKWYNVKVIKIVLKFIRKKGEKNELYFYYLS